MGSTCNGSQDFLVQLSPFVVETNLLLQQIQLHKKSAAGIRRRLAAGDGGGGIVGAGGGRLGTPQQASQVRNTCDVRRPCFSVLSLLVGHCAHVRGVGGTRTDWEAPECAGCVRVSLCCYLSAVFLRREVLTSFHPRLASLTRMLAWNNTRGYASFLRTHGPFALPRSIGCVWLSGIAGTFALLSTRTGLPLQLRVVHARVYAQGAWRMEGHDVCDV